MMVLLGLVVCGAVFMFFCGMFVGLTYEHSLRRLRHRDLDATARRYLDAEAALCHRRAGKAEAMAFRKARERLAKAVGWESTAPPESGTVRVGARHAQELAS